MGLYIATNLHDNFHYQVLPKDYSIIEDMEQYCWKHKSKQFWMIKSMEMFHDANLTVINDPRYEIVNFIGGIDDSDREYGALYSTSDMTVFDRVVKQFQRLERENKLNFTHQFIIDMQDLSNRYHQPKVEWNICRKPPSYEPYKKVLMYRRMVLLARLTKVRR